jgi:hypothetical protein
VKIQACERCAEKSVRARQIYIIDGPLGRSIFDIEKAKSIVKDRRRQPVLVPKTVVERFLKINQWTAEHCQHVNLGVPGIIGQRFGGLTLFDGTHRAARSHLEGVPFWAHVLDCNESRDCLIDQRSAEMEPAVIASEIRGVLANNPHAELLHVELSYEGTPAELGEQAIRSCLTEEENAHVRLVGIGRESSVVKCG